MIKKFLLLGLVVAQMTTSCSNDDTENSQTSSENLNDQVANLMKQPYSKLTPAEQKVKLEAEANAMLVQMNKSKTSGAVEAIQNLGNLLDVNSVDIFSGKNNNKIADILNVSGVYGIYTWNSTNKLWIKTISTTELKFVFPAKASQTLNNAVLSSTAVSSDIKVKLSDTNGNWVYNPNTQAYTQTPAINDEFYLPTSVDAILTIDKAQAATFVTKAKYSNGKETPDESSFKMVLNDGYTFEISGKKGDPNSAQSIFTYNNKNLIKFTAGSTAKIDALLEDDVLVSYRGKANGLVELMDNFIIVADLDLATSGKEDEALEKSLIYPPELDYSDPKADWKGYFTAWNNYDKKEVDGSVANYNKNMKLILVSKKDGTKIADVVSRAEKGYASTLNLPIWNSTDKYWDWWSDKGELFTQQYYDEVFYLKFNDDTEVEMSAYFSTGFDDLEKKFEDFLKSFER
ncbi:hypothetical protein SAMN05444372_10171 [Flavobacterium micromati]|uniref:Lipoprotein n=1 Tax=Flavobacterium micromati TaxID=229205 RepID=A0A1M5FCT1_9FLAO|nr:hypothetical protein [Flavobacterium micromati]SHF89289.1 hypothetical protein SAMN05444372_10171 [Flavobacterium micromati]